jgi:nucleotide-binding universal stress UspA family protein
MAGTIVCGIDDSRGGREALIAGAALSQRLGSRLLTVNVTSVDRVFPYGDAALLERERHSALERATRLLERVVGDGRGAPAVDLHVELGRPAARLAAVATEEGAELVVVGSRGRNRLSSTLLGSVSRELVAHAPCPVLVVPPGSRGIHANAEADARPTSVVCGVDESSAAQAVARQAATLARRLRARLAVVHAYRQRPYYPGVAGPARRAARARLEAIALTLPPGVELRLARGDAATELRRVAREETAELIVIGSPERGPIPTLVSGSVASDLVASAHVPVLVATDGGWRDITGADQRAGPDTWISPAA